MKRIPFDNLTVATFEGDGGLAFVAFNPENGKTTNGIVNAGSGNVRYAEYLLRGRYPETGELRWFWTHSEMKSRAYRQLTKEMPYVGSNPETILEHIKTNLS